MIKRRERSRLSGRGRLTVQSEVFEVQYYINVVQEYIAGGGDEVPGRTDWRDGDLTALGDARFIPAVIHPELSEPTNATLELADGRQVIINIPHFMSETSQLTFTVLKVK